jgi:hypothetical protein
MKVAFLHRFSKDLTAITDSAVDGPFPVPRQTMGFVMLTKEASAPKARIIRSTTPVHYSFSALFSYPRCFLRQHDKAHRLAVMVERVYTHPGMIGFLEYVLNNPPRNALLFGPG